RAAPGRASRSGTGARRAGPRSPRTGRACRVSEPAPLRGRAARRKGRPSAPRRRASRLPFLLRQRLERLEDPVGARVHADGRDIAPPVHAALVDDEERAPTEAVLLAVRAVRARDGALRLEVREQREPELAIARERRVAPRPVDRDPEELRAESCEFRPDLVLE